MNLILNDLIVRETIQGGPAHYRPPKRIPNLLLARHRAEQAQARAEMPNRVVCVKLPRLFAHIRLPRWMPLSTLLD
jgi:hypothetical protein